MKDHVQHAAVFVDEVFKTLVLHLGKFDFEDFQVPEIKDITFEEVRLVVSCLSLLFFDAVV